MSGRWAPLSSSDSQTVETRSVLQGGDRFANQTQKERFCVVSASPSLLAKITSSTQIVLCSHGAGKTASEGGLTFRPHRSAARSPSSPRRSQTSAAAKVKESKRESSSKKRRRTQIHVHVTKTGKGTLQGLQPLRLIRDSHSLQCRPGAPFSGAVCWTAHPSPPEKGLQVLGGGKKNTEQELREFEMDVFEGGATFK